MKVLIIEDDISLARTIKNYLKLKGMEVFHADNGATGIQMAFEMKPDVIVCDINIPVIDGYQVFKVLNETEVKLTVPFIFLTAKTDLKEIREGMKLGVDDYITKPFDFSDLYSSITMRIEKRQRLLKTNEDKFLTLLNNSEHGAFICSKDKFALVNQKMISLFGYSQFELEQKNLISLADSESKQLVEKTVSRCINERQKEAVIEFDATHKRLKTLRLKLVAGFSNYNGQPCIVGYLINLTGDTYRLTDVSLSKEDLFELGKAIEIFSTDYDFISKDLVNKLSNVFKQEKKKTEQNFLPIDLTIREKEVLNEICLGKSSPEIAESLFISERTVEKHRAAIINKTGSKNMIEAVIVAIRNDLVDL